MKNKKILTLIAMGIVTLSSIIGITGCNKQDHNHIYTNYISDNNATCTSDGTKTAVCDVAGCEEQHIIIDSNTALGHLFDNYVSNNDATFFENGTKTADCSRNNCNCSNTIVDDNSMIMTELPFFNILTENLVDIVSKEDYVKCNVSLSNTDYEYEFSELKAKIKGRGNSTWGAAKKPYKLKFDKKVDLFGNGAAKTWTILANYYDKSLIRNYLAFGIADLFNSQTMCTSTHFVNLFVNNEFYGIYLICEQIEVADTRVEVDENYNNVDTGYLIELDGKAPNEGVLNKDYFNLNNKSYAIKSPDTEDEEFTEEHVNFIKSYMDNVMSYFKETHNWQELCELIDARSFAENYIVEELFHNADVGYSSFYMYKKEGGKLYAGPVWDFDLSSGFYFSTISETFYNPEGHYACLVNPWYAGLMQYDEFKIMVAEILNEKKDDIVDKITDMTGFVLSLETSFLNEFILWDQSSKGWHTEIVNLKDWLLRSINYLYDDYSQYL